MKLDSKLVIALLLGYAATFLVSIVGLVVIATVHDGSVTPQVVGILSNLVTVLIAALGPVAGGTLGVVGVVHALNQQANNTQATIQQASAPTPPAPGA